MRSLLAALAAPLALLLLALAGDASPLRVAVGLAALVWAPGHALVAALYPLRASRLSGLERAALACGLGLVMLPALGLAVSIAWSLTPAHVAIAALGLTAALAAIAWRRGEARGRGGPAPAPRAPSTRATFGIAGAALVVSAALFAGPLLAAPETPAALSLANADDPRAPLPEMLNASQGFRVNVTLEAGGAAREGVLVATLGNETLLTRDVSLAAGQRATMTLDVPGLASGDAELRVVWTLDPPRETHAWLHVEAPHA